MFIVWLSEKTKTKIKMKPGAFEEYLSVKDNSAPILLCSFQNFAVSHPRNYELVAWLDWFNLQN